MRIRTIKPEFWSHPVMSKQSDSTKLMAIALLNLADDDGYFFADPRMVRNAVRPLDDDSRITTVSLRELSKIGYISIKKHETHGDIGFVENFKSHQVINKPKPSKIKDFYNYGINTGAIPDEYGQEGKGMEQGSGKGKELFCPIVSLIWHSANPKGRERSSKKQLQDEWDKIPARDKPTEETLIESLAAWNKSQKWQDGFAEAIHRWIKNRQWENKPQPEQPKNTQHSYKQNRLNETIDMSGVPGFE